MKCLISILVTGRKQHESIHYNTAGFKKNIQKTQKRNFLLYKFHVNVLFTQSAHHSLKLYFILAN